MPGVSSKTVTKVFPGGTVAVDDLSLEIADGEFMILVGSSGCGKTTALRMIAGLEQADIGTIRIGERVVNDVSARGPRHRDGVPELRAVPAHDRLPQPRLPAAPAAHAQARDRPPGRRGRARCSASRSCSSAARASCRAASASAWRWAARSSASPKVFLLDEPLSNLDAKLRVQMRAGLKRLHGRLGDHDRLRHPRPGRGDDARRPDRGPVGRQAPAARPAPGGLRPPRERVRGGVHRQPADEPAAGAAPAPGR